MRQREGPLRVYLVEDSPIMGNLLKDLLAAVGGTIVGHSDKARIAIEEIAHREVDVVLVDISLREGSGFDVLQATLDTHAGKRPTRVVLTNHSTPAYREAAARLDVDGYFDKSTQIVKMIEFIASLRAR